MDDNSDNSNDAKRRSRSSLVERAAEKLAADRGAPAPKDEMPASDPAAVPVSARSPVRTPAVEPVAPLDAASADEVLELNVEALPEPGVEETARETTLAEAAEVKEAREEAPAPHGRKPRIATIDLQNLMARNILTPETKRNRTVEEFRLIKRQILSHRWDQGDAPGNTIVVTSALPSEGKTTTAINLAMSIAAEEDLRVLLVDADFIKPDALRQLGISATKGLIDVIEDPRLDIADVMLRTNIDKLSLIPAGQLHERCTELLASARMDEIIHELASRYEDRILIFDSPPLLATTESVTLASHMGQVVFVVQAGRTKRDTLNNALDLLGDRPHLGLVLNRTTSRIGSSGFGSYYDSYYYGYGDKKQA